MLNATSLGGSGEGWKEVVNAARDHQLSTMKNVELSDDEAQVLSGAIDSDRYPLSPRVQVLRAILARLRPEPARPAASPEPTVYAPPSKRGVIATPRMKPSRLTSDLSV